MAVLLSACEKHTHLCVVLNKHVTEHVSAAYWVALLSRNKENLDLIFGTGRYLVTWMKKGHNYTSVIGSYP